MLKINYFFRFRVTCYNIQKNSWFKNLILACILASSLMLAMEDPVGTKDSEEQTEVGKRHYFFLRAFLDQIWLELTLVYYDYHRRNPSIK